MTLHANPLYHLWTRLTRAKTADDAGIPPYWALLCFVPASSYSQSGTYDSCTFEKLLVREIGVKSSTAEHGVTFAIPETLERFQTFGNVRFLNESLKMFAIGIAKFLQTNSTI